jgi:hypothetical protein
MILLNFILIKNSMYCKDRIVGFGTYRTQSRYRTKSGLKYYYPKISNYKTLFLNLSSSSSKHNHVGVWARVFSFSRTKQK